MKRSLFLWLLDRVPLMMQPGIQVAYIWWSSIYRNLTEFFCFKYHSILRYPLLLCFMISMLPFSVFWTTCWGKPSWLGISVLSSIQFRIEPADTSVAHFNKRLDLIVAVNLPNRTFHCVQILYEAPRRVTDFLQGGESSNWPRDINSINDIVMNSSSSFTNKSRSIHAE